MYKCICGYTSSSKVAMEQHMRLCAAVRSKSNVSSSYSDSFVTTSVFDFCCSTVSDTSTSSSYDSSSSYSGSDGSYDGGGASDSW